MAAMPFRLGRHPCFALISRSTLRRQGLIISCSIVQLTRLFVLAMVGHDLCHFIEGQREIGAFTK
jgi:hypothetical protein